jgi:hypothetical protein
MTAPRVGDRRPAADSLGTPEGHAVRDDADGTVIGVTTINARWLIDGDGMRRRPRSRCSIGRSH